MAESAAGDVYKESHHRHGTKNKKNALLIKPVVGKAKKTVYDLPPVTHTYGRKEAGDAAGVREAVGSWKPHVPNPGDEPPRDFVKINRLAATAKVTNPKGTAQFRRSIDIRVQTSPARVASGDPFAGVTFGAASEREGTPMASVLSNAYQRQWIAKNHQAESKDRDFKSTSKTRLLNKTRSPTKASMGHHRLRLAEPKPRFVMKRFQGVPGRAPIPKKAGSPSATAPAAAANPEVYVPAPGSPYHATATPALATAPNPAPAAQPAAH